MTACNYVNYGWENSPPPTILLCCPVSDRTGAQDLSSNWAFRKVQCNRRKPGLTGKKKMQSFKSNQHWKTFTQQSQSNLCPAPGHAKFRVTSSQVFCVIQGRRSSLWRTVLTKNKKPPTNPHPTHQKKGKTNSTMQHHIYTSRATSNECQTTGLHHRAFWTVWATLFITCSTGCSWRKWNRCFTSESLQCLAVTHQSAVIWGALPTATFNIAPLCKLRVQNNMTHDSGCKGLGNGNWPCATRELRLFSFIFKQI